METKPTNFVNYTTPDIDAAPSLMMPIISKEENEHNCLEEDKLLLINSSFYYDTEIDKNDFYKVTYNKNVELNYKRIKQNNKKYDKYIDNYHYNCVNLMEYIKEVIKQVKEINKNNINFKLILNLKGDKKIEKNFNVKCKYFFYYIDKTRNIEIKKKYEHRNIFDDITQLSKINTILNEIKDILIKINLNNKVVKQEVNEEKNENKKIRLIDCSKLKIINFIKCIATHKNTVQMIKQLPCGNYVSCGFDGQIFLFDEDLNQIHSDNTIKNPIYSISEIPGTQNEFMACCPEKIYLLSINDKKINVDSKRLITESLNLFSFSTKEDEIIFCGNNTISKFNGKIKEITIENNNNNKSILNSITATCGKKLTDNIFAIVSNKIMENGDDKLLYYNINKWNVFKKEEDYSFNTGPNSLFLIETDIDINREDNNKKKSNRKKKNKKNNIIINNKKEKAKLLFCACTKYEQDQKNGILVLCPYNISIKKKFYDTEDFEVFCFCLLNNDINDKKYLLVGGFDNNLNQGLIKLYDIILYNEIELTELKFNRNIKDFSRFKQPISCIIQSTKTGEIVVTSWDGTINLFSKPNIEQLEQLEQN